MNGIYRFTMPKCHSKLFLFVDTENGCASRVPVCKFLIANEYSAGEKHKNMDRGGLRQLQKFFLGGLN